MLKRMGVFVASERHKGILLHNKGYVIKKKSTLDSRKGSSREKKNFNISTINNIRSSI